MFRDDLEAVQARVATLESELVAERKLHEAAEAEAAAARAARDEALLAARRQPAQVPRFRLGLGLLIGLVAGAGISSIVLLTTTHPIPDRRPCAGQLVAEENLRRATAEHAIELAEAKSDVARCCGAIRRVETQEAPAEPARPPEGSPADTVSRADIQRVIARNRKDLQRCYEEALQRRPALGGRLDIKITISGSGRVAAAAVTSSTLGDAAAERCMAAAVRSWVFPASGSVVTVLFPFVFGAAR